MADSQYQFNSHADSQDCVSIVLDRSGAKSVNVYPLKRIARDFNTALDFYWDAALSAVISIDDLTQATPPLEEYTITSGTNRYKLGSFTADIIELIKLEALDSAGTGIELKEEKFIELGTGPFSLGDSAKTFQELYISADSGTPSHYCVYGDFIYLRPSPNYTKASALIAHFNRPATYMASTDTTDVPGVPTIHIPLLCDLSANEFKYSKGLMSLSEKMAYESVAARKIKDYWTRKEKGSRNIISARITSFR